MNNLLKTHWLEGSVVLLAFVAYLSGMHQLELRAEEPRRGLVSMEMVESGEYIVPRTYGMAYLNKPPFHNWCIAAMFKITGSYEDWLVRLPGVLSLILTAVLIFYFLTRNGQWAAAFPGALTFLTFGDLLFYGSVNAGEIDLLYSLFIFLQTLGVYAIIRGKLIQGYLLAYGFCALAVLTKSLPAILFLGLTLIAALTVEKSLKKLITWQHLTGIVLFSLIVGSYYYAYAQRGDLEILLVNIFQQGQDKNTLIQARYHTMLELVEYPWLFIRIGLPWTLGLFLLMKKNLRQKIWSNKVTRYMALFIISNVWVYWFIVANKIRYSYPFYPALAIILGYMIISIPIFKRRLNLIYGIMALMLILRIGFNFIVLPKMQDGQISESYIHRDLAENVYKITDGAQIDLYAGKEYYQGSLPWNTEKVISYERPGIFPYQVPYYVNKQNKQVMKWVDELEPEGYYMAPVDFLKEKGLEPEELLRFRNRWASQDVILFNSASLQK